MGREQILASLRTGLGESRAWLEGEAARAGHAAPPYVLPPADDLAAQFAAELVKVEGRCYRVADDEEALETIGRLLEERGASQVTGWELGEIGLPGLSALLAERGVTFDSANLHSGERKARLQALEPAPVCISGAELAIAESGTLLLRHGPGRPRLASLLAPAHIAVLRTGQLVRGLGEALARMRSVHGADLFTTTSNLTLITGPSRTADIEMTLALGIHGPPQIHVVLIEGPEALADGGR